MRSNYCGLVNEEHIGQEVVICGWVHRRRDHGGVIFLDMRDREGIAQIVFDPDTEESFANAERVRSEYVLQIKGIVRARPDGDRQPTPGSARDGNARQRAGGSVDSPLRGGRRRG